MERSASTSRLQKCPLPANYTIKVPVAVTIGETCPILLLMFIAVLVINITASILFVTAMILLSFLGKLIWSILLAAAVTGISFYRWR